MHLVAHPVGVTMPSGLNGLLLAIIPKTGFGFARSPAFTVVLDVFPWLFLVLFCVVFSWRVVGVATQLLHEGFISLVVFGFYGK